MEFYRTWRILMAHRSILIWLPVIATCAALGLSFVLPEQYESSALVLVRPFEEIKFNSNSSDQKISEFPVNLSAPIDALSKTYVEVIKSPAVAMRIVEALQLQVQKPKQYQNLFEAIKGRLGTWVGNTMRTVRNYCKYGRDIPASPFDLAVEDVEQNLTVSVRKDTYAFDITARAKDPEQAAAIANMAAKIFVEHNSQAYRSESARAREFIGTQLDESRSELDRARAAILSFEKSSGTFELNSEYNDSLKNLSDLEDTIAKDQGKLTGLRRLAGKFTPNMLAQEAEIAELKAESSGLLERLAAFPEEETEMRRLQLNEHLAEKSYEFFRKQYDEARVKESETVTEIRIVSPAVPTLYPVKPVKYVYAGLSFATALLVAIGLALLLESSEPRVRTIRDLDAELGVPVLGAIPRSVPAGQ
jgi:succinoglycan biosynthesis transport protein ExoP